jgi:hypothetical protein
MDASTTSIPPATVVEQPDTIVAASILDHRQDCRERATNFVAESLPSTRRLYKKLMKELAANLDGATANHLRKKLKLVHSYLKDCGNDMGLDFMSPAAVLKKCEGVERRQVGSRSLCCRKGAATEEAGLRTQHKPLVVQKSCYVVLILVHMSIPSMWSRGRARKRGLLAPLQYRYQKECWVYPMAEHFSLQQLNVYNS